MTNIRTPLTHALAGVMVAVWLLVGFTIGEGEAAMIAGFIPASIGGAVTQPVPAFLTPLTSAFLHTGAMHIIFNMIMMIFCGRWVETALGARLTGILFVVGAYVAALTQWATKMRWWRRSARSACAPPAAEALPLLHCGT